MTEERLEQINDYLKAYSDARHGPDADMSHEEGFDWAERFANIIGEFLSEDAKS
ncbi:MAG TPA: hypothetical protein VN653_10905 [Anaerolineales bacterium]|nr:hypothetical protein [Anaerolineales bacterium]